jgi:hypothetical protein
MVIIDVRTIYPPNAPKKSTSALGRNALASDEKKRWDAAKQQDAEALEAALFVASGAAFFVGTKAWRPFKRPD